MEENNIRVESYYYCQKLKSSWLYDKIKSNTQEKTKNTQNKIFREIEEYLKSNEYNINNLQ